MKSYAAQPANDATTNMQREAVAVAAGAAAGAAAPAALLNAAGFAAAGPLAGSLAAGWQASIGAAVSSGSTFSCMQSLAMGGAGAALVPIACAAGVACVGYQYAQRTATAAAQEEVPRSKL